MTGKLEVESHKRQGGPEVLVLYLKRPEAKRCIAQILSSIPYEEIPYTPPKLPKRQKREGYAEPKQKHRTVPQVW